MKTPREQVTTQNGTLRSLGEVPLNNKEVLACAREREREKRGQRPTKKKFQLVTLQGCSKNKETGKIKTGTSSLEARAV